VETLKACATLRAAAERHDSSLSAARFRVRAIPAPASPGVSLSSAEVQQLGALPAGMDRSEGRTAYAELLLNRLKQQLDRASVPEQFAGRALSQFQSVLLGVLQQLGKQFSSAGTAGTALTEEAQTRLVAGLVCQATHALQAQLNLAVAQWRAWEKKQADEAEQQRAQLKAAAVQAAALQSQAAKQQQLQMQQQQMHQQQAAARSAGVGAGAGAGGAGYIQAYQPQFHGGSPQMLPPAMQQHFMQQYQQQQPQPGQHLPAQQQPFDEPPAHKPRSARGRCDVLCVSSRVLTNEVTPFLMQAVGVGAVLQASIISVYSLSWLCL
jgi:hypothetical protein